MAGNAYYDPPFPVGLLKITNIGPSTALQGCNLQAKIKEQGEHVHAKTLPWDLAVSYVFFLMDPEVKEVYVRGPNGGRYYDSLRAP